MFPCFDCSFHSIDRCSNIFECGCNTWSRESDWEITQMGRVGGLECYINVFFRSNGIWRLNRWMCRTTIVYVVNLEFPNKPFHNQLGFQDKQEDGHLCQGFVWDRYAHFVWLSSSPILWAHCSPPPVPHCCPSWGSCHGNTYTHIAQKIHIVTHKWSQAAMAKP